MNVFYEKRKYDPTQETFYKTLIMGCEEVSRFGTITERKSQTSVCDLTLHSAAHTHTSC